MTHEDATRYAMLGRLQAAWSFLVTSPIRDCAAELVVQGLDLVSQEARAAVIAAAIAELDAQRDDSAAPGPATP